MSSVPCGESGGGESEIKIIYARREASAIVSLEINHLMRASENMPKVKIAICGDEFVGCGATCATLLFFYTYNVYNNISYFFKVLKPTPSYIYPRFFCEFQQK